MRDEFGDTAADREERLANFRAAEAANDYLDEHPEAVAIAEPDNPTAVSGNGKSKSGGQDQRPIVPDFMNVQTLLRRYPTMRRHVIDGLLRRGESLNVIAPSKTGKSWLCLSLAMAVATGRKWLDSFGTVAGDVLVVDNELHAETLANRVPKVAMALGIEPNELADNFNVWCVRGCGLDVYGLAGLLESNERKWTLIILDALYRCIPTDVSENDNSGMGGLYNRIDAMADRLGTAVALIHHTSKGVQSGKAVTDVGSGAGSMSRATDSHLVMRPHEEPGVVVLDAAVRSFPPVDARCLRWEYPIWSPAPDLDPARLQVIPTRRRSAPPKDSPIEIAWTVVSFLDAFLSEKPTTKAELRESISHVSGMSWRRADGFLQIAEGKGMIERKTLPGRGAQVAYVRKQTKVSE